jgi:hypothetical protein
MSTRHQKDVGGDVSSGVDTGTEQTDDADVDEESAVDLPLDQVFETLKNERRRTVLRYLDTHDGTVALGDLAEKVAAIENDKPVGRVTSRERKCAYVGLYQCHLPKMDDMDIVEFNQNRGRISVGPNAGQLERYLDWEESTERPWQLYYGAVSALGFTMVTLTALGTGAGLTAVASVASLLALAVVAVVHATVDAGSPATLRSLVD